MKRSTTLLVALLTVTSGVAAFFAVGSAFGADWYDYKGRLTPGNAYLVSVPEGAEALELGLVANGDGAAATVAVFDPEDGKSAVWKLAGGGTASLAQPERGSYVLFVYSLTNGGLTLRLSSDAAADDLDVKRLGLDREDVRLASVGSPAPLGETFTAKASREPVFATLLYSGSVENLAGSLASSKGEVLAITGETGTAYGPGLYGSVAGAREVSPENLAPGSYTGTFTADRFEGDLWMTFVYYQRDMLQTRPLPVNPEDPETPDRPGVPEKPVFEDAVEIAPWTPTAVQVPLDQTSLVFSLASMREAEDEESEDDNWTAGGGDEFPAPWSFSGYHYGCPEMIRVFDPLDNLVAILTLDSETMTAELPIDTPGEYVVFVHGGSEEDPLLLSLALGEAAAAVKPDVREIGTVEEEIELGETDMLFGNLEAGFALEKAPLFLGASWYDRFGRLDSDAVFTSEVGEAVRERQLFAGPGWQFSEGHEVSWENLVAGEYVFTTSSTLGGAEVVAKVITFDRTLDVEAEVEEEDEA